MDREIVTWFFWYSLTNTFLGAVLGGGVFSQAGNIGSASGLLEAIGTAIPTTSNFFIQVWWCGVASPGGGGGGRATGRNGTGVC